jgi:hypothetical protein
MVLNDTFNNISAISWWSVFTSGGNQSTQRKPLICHKSLTDLFYIFGALMSLSAIFQLYRGDQF